MLDFMIAAYSDAGIRKQINEDALLVKTARTKSERICFAVICDGLGGLSKGEVASASLIRAMDEWFNCMMPQNLKDGVCAEVIKQQWEKIVDNQNERMYSYALSRNVRMGTTLTALLIDNGHYYIMNIGDTRAYMLTKRLRLLTKDHTFVQYEMDHGRITQKEAILHPKRNVLMQCVGASGKVNPDFYTGVLVEKTVFMLCSDGFRHEITEQEIFENLNPKILTNEQMMRSRAKMLIKLNKERLEVDNISVAVVKPCQEVKACLR